MRRYIAAIALVSFIAGVAVAGELGRNRAAADSGAPGAAVIADEAAGVVRIVIDGRETARFDAAGLHVRENIQYGGAAVDAGQDQFDRYIAGAGHAE